MLEQMELHINTLYCTDAAGRLRSTNEIDAMPAPLFYMGRTPAGNRWRFHHDLPAATVEALDRLCAAEPVAGDLTRPPHQAAVIHQVLREHLGLAQTRDYRGPAYWIPAGA